MGGLNRRKVTGFTALNPSQALSTFGPSGKSEVRLLWKMSPRANLLLGSY